MDITSAATALGSGEAVDNGSVPTPREGVDRTIVFLHGWGLAGRTYQTPLGQLERRGLRVHAPTMPGFGGTAALSADRNSLCGYASWVGEYLESLDTGPVVLIGHSFGGSVAAIAAHQAPELVSHLVLMNAVGGTVWRTGPDGSAVPMADRPLWDWIAQLYLDLLPVRGSPRALPAILREVVPAAVVNPLALWRTGCLARTADLVRELGELSHRGIPVTVVSSRNDAVVPAAATAALCGAHNAIRAITVGGGHSWLLADPDRFGRVVFRAMERSPADAGYPSAPDHGAARHRSS
ncbi:alpha/beta fold hydrolase [Nocardia vaccinii]|uniref:alpha/beta fold hydrolase n=1 Tax=Nocardia vaccinii TaxID=1822 RepID=UPI000A9325EF|nr:alpha/beta hydrolase [Nocardia vaccinii]